MGDSVACNQITSSLGGWPAHGMSPGVLLPRDDTADLSFVIGSYITEVLTDGSRTRTFSH